MWGETPLDGYPPASCNPPKPPGSPPPFPPVSPQVQFGNLIYTTVTRVPEPGSGVLGAFAVLALAGLTGRRCNLAREPRAAS